MKLFKDFQMNQIVKIILGVVIISVAMGVLGGALRTLFPESAYYILLGGLCGAFSVIFLSPIIGKKKP
ncbi:MAG: hypothetical protein F7B06_12770 [Opitutae bacterium]|nr:hypothetical protein [Opitutae bacterium]